MSDAKIVLRKTPYYKSYYVLLIAGKRVVHLPDSGGYSYSAAKTYAVKRAHWWSERTGITFEEPTND